MKGRADVDSVSGLAEVAGFCRDCLARFGPPAPARCRACGSPRILAHPELGRLAIGHVDCDAFYASVAKRDDPSLADKPVIIGGGRRGVVLTACYIARTYGVRSAMPMFKALKACPHAVVVKPDMARYQREGRAVRAMMGALTPLVQPVSIDEAFLDLAGTEGLHGAPPALTLARFAQAVEREIGITVSIGLGDCKFLAKLASDLDKPRGFAVIGRAEAVAFLRPRPVGSIWGVGAVSAKRLAARGFETIGDIQDCDEKSFARRAGGDGSRLWALARGIDPRPVSPEREAKSVSAETTFAADLALAEDLLPILYRLCEKVAARLADADLAAGGVVLKLKTHRFEIRTRSRSGLPPTQLAARLFEAGRALLGPELDGTPYRLIGIGAADLRPGADADRADLLDTALKRQMAAARATAAVREKFGSDALVRGITLTRARGEAK
jgi:DNA polymerase-4